MKPLLVLPLLAALHGAADAADTLYTGGPIVTMDDRQPQAEAVVVRDGDIAFVGTRADALSFSPGARQVDLQGRTLVPGFIDSHGHVSGVGLQALSANLLPAPDGDGNAIPALQDIMRRFRAAATLPGGYRVLIGFGYDDSQLAEKRHPTRTELDAIATDIPVILMHQSGHLGAYNSKALEQAGINVDTPDPEGGVIRREPGSRVPDGVLEESAHTLALARLMPALSIEQAMAMLEAGQALYMKHGYTTAQDGKTDAGTLAMLPMAGKAGRLKIDVVAYPDIQVALDSPAMRGPYYGPDYIDHFRIGGVKISLDGSPQGKTAWLSQPYYKAPAGEKAEYAGYPAYSDAQADALIGKAWGNGWQVLAHANGDAAIDQFIRAVAAAEAAHPDKRLLPVLIHGQTLRRDQVGELRRLGIFPSLFPMHTYYWGDWHRDSVLGPKRAENISPTRWVLDAGMVFTSHHDAPVVFPDAMRVLDATVNRTTRSGRVLGPAQRVTQEQALKSITLWAARQYAEEARKGSIETGKRADLVVLSDNPLTIAPANLHTIQVLRTIKDGNVVYNAEEREK
ncbi:amidohydrolase family protein [Stenotrophomonas sp. MYb238]|uniref:amidohydrolase n=1 Tax=Stenotrophomonas sp. MYb238 TaxID=2040281 RepID=UPI00129118FE|nr:amidohydrolase [Stenotrophomonas sp. MYb238]MQP76545.1 amidohydrolase family protein [Stenotrophomonas sp. MYb238]